MQSREKKARKSVPRVRGRGVARSERRGKEIDTLPSEYSCRNISVRKERKREKRKRGFNGAEYSDCDLA